MALSLEGIVLDVIVVCHTEPGFVRQKKVVFDDTIDGVKEGVRNLINVADKHKAKVTFVVMPQIAEHFPKGVRHEIGLHLHPGLAGCRVPVKSIFLKDYSFDDQLEMIRVGKQSLQDMLSVDPKVFVAGMWSENTDTTKALIDAGFTHDCTPTAHQKTTYFDWSKLPRICMPYRPSEEDYQKKGALPLLYVPVSQMLVCESVNPEVIPLRGLSWLKACFLEYYEQDMPLFHICLHSPSMTDSYFVKALDEFLGFISKHEVSFKFSSEIKDPGQLNPRTNLLPYLTCFHTFMLTCLHTFALNRSLAKTMLKAVIRRTFRISGELE